jgi:hypothetical protein
VLPQQGVEQGNPDLENDPRWQLAQRVAASKALAGSPALQSFLLYISSQTLQGHADRLKEQMIGVAVFHRRSDYDPSDDNIVRVRAGQLRNRLDQYFHSDGESEPLVVSIPKGGYVPVFEPRRAEPEPVVPDRAGIPAHPARTVWPYWVAIGCLAALSLFLAFRASRTMAEAPKFSAASRRLWGQMFEDGDEVLVVMGDVTYALWQDLTGRTLTLADYVGRRYLDSAPPEQRPLLNEIAARRYTSIADANIGSKLPAVAGSFGKRTRVRFARHIDVRDIQAGSVIFLGSRRANPWVELFESRLHYAFGYNTETRRPFFQNRTPKAGEPDILWRGNDPVRDSYAVIAMLPNLNGRGRILMIEGLSLEGTDAAGEFLMNPRTCDELARRVAAELGGADKPFEALLKLTPVAGGSANARLVALKQPNQP